MITRRVTNHLSTCDLADCTAPIVAKALAMSDTTLRRKLRREGATFAELLQAERVRRVETAIAERPSINAKRLAGICGYNETNHFYRAFKGWFGNKYTQYRSATYTTQEPAP
jgi:AraC-like DNA-binding protein